MAKYSKTICYITLNADSDTICHYLKTTYFSTLLEPKKLAHGPKEVLPNERTIQETHNELLPITSTLYKNHVIHLCFQDHQANHYHPLINCVMTIVPPYSQK